MTCAIVSVGWLSTILKRQRNNDFKPKDEELSFARTTTEPCTMSCGFLEKLVDLVKKDLPGKNGVSVLTEIGVEFHA